MTPILADIVEFELVPLIEEYWFDNPEQIRHWEAELRKALDGARQGTSSAWAFPCRTGPSTRRLPA